MKWLYLNNRVNDEVITMMCTPSKESATGPMLQGIAPDQFDHDTGIFLGSPATQEQLAVLESAAGRLAPPYQLQTGFGSLPA